MTTDEARAALESYVHQLAPTKTLTGEQHQELMRLTASIEAEARAAALDVERLRAVVPAIMRAMFREVPLCTGCDFDHGWDDHVLAVWDAEYARLAEADR